MEASILQILFCDFLYAFAFLLLFKVMLGKKVSKHNVRLAFLAMALMCLFAFITGDYFHYKEWFESININDRTHMESIYQTIASFSPSYLIFRFIVWGGALLFLASTFKLTKIDYSVAVFLFIVRNFISFAYARVSLCMAMIFCALVLISKIWERKVFYALIGVFLLFISYYFHKTAIFGIGVGLMSLLLIKQRRISILIVIILIPFFISSLTTLVDTYMGMEFSDTDTLIEGGQKYLESGRTRFTSFSKNLIDIIWRIPYFIVLIMYLKTISSGKFNSMPIPIRVFANAAAISVFVSSLFLFVPDIYNYVLYYRFLNYSMIPSVVFVTYCYSNRIYPFLVKSVYYLSLLGVVLSLMYRTAIQIM